MGYFNALVRRQPSAGFTLVEILLVMGLIAVLAAATLINFIRPQNQASLDGITNALVTDIKSQQIKAMAGDGVSASSAQAHGVYVQAGSYTLFKGSAYSGADTDNFAISTDTITLTPDLPSSQVVFTKATGDVSGFDSAHKTITVSSSALGASKVITINRYGAVTVN
jgi:prepilin-type N-terminal cleavage/methylation domain-containing protein